MVAQFSLQPFGLFRLAAFPQLTNAILHGLGLCSAFQIKEAFANLILPLLCLFMLIIGPKFRDAAFCLLQFLCLPIRAALYSVIFCSRVIFPLPDLNTPTGTWSLQNDEGIELLRRRVFFSAP